jgi:hypothetical protein
MKETSMQLARQAPRPPWLRAVHTAVTWLAKELAVGFAVYGALAAGLGPDYVEVELVRGGERAAGVDHENNHVV